MKKYLSTLAMLLLVAWQAMAQDKVITGVVTDKNDGSALAGVNVVVKNTTTGTSTDVNGKFSLRAPASASTMVFSYIGYGSEEVTIPASNYLAVALSSSVHELEGATISVGSRSSQRTITDSPLPIDILSAKEITNTGQATFDRALQYRVPSFNVIQAPANDATSFLDPYEIRNMGPSRTLVLINGKRKNTSALVYLQPSPGRGEGGPDLSAIPNEAIKRVEILRDGASAQYGSDAIAGVMNIILKDHQDYGTITLNTGITYKGDGEMIGLALNNGAKFMKTGFVNYTLSLSHQALTNRAGKVDPQGEAFLFGADINTVNEFLKKKPDAGNINGDPEKSTSHFLINAGLPVSGTVELYGNAAYVYKKVNSFATWRPPYWRPASERPDGKIDNPYALLQGVNNYLGYYPTFDGDLTDYSGTIGFRSENNGWKSDVSYTFGGNKQLYTITNSRNRSLGLNSPLVFKPGGYEFNHNVGNVDVNKMLVENLNFGIGMEFRREVYKIFKGDTASVVGTGADSFPGIGEADATENTRSNVGGYLDLSYDINKDFLANGTVRFENYNDFGSTTVYKISSRYKLADGKVTLRASYSTGFRAPMLHQIYLQSTQIALVPGLAAQKQGIFSNNSLQTRLLGVPKLKPEKSTNFSVGAGFKPTQNMSLTLDYYNIQVKDRIILSSEIVELDTTTPLGKILADNGVLVASFFTNGINTRTSGVDFVGSYRNIMLGSGKLTVNLAGNFTIYNKLDGDVINPPLIADAGKSIFDATQEALLLSSRPEYKIILGLDYGWKRVSFNLNNTVFGPTTFHQTGLDPNLHTVFQTNLVTDFGVSLELAKNLTFGATVQNAFNVMPKYKIEALNPAGEAVLNDPVQLSHNITFLTLSGRYPVSYTGSQFNQFGTHFVANLTMRF